MAPKTVASDAVTPALRDLKQDKRVDCTFVHPAQEQTKYIVSTDTVLLPPEEIYGILFPHSIAVNELYYQKLVSGWVTKEITSEEIIDQGIEIGVKHEEICDNLGFLDTVDKQEQAVCVMYNALWKQMIKTCFYNSLEKDFKSVAAFLMEGFAFGAYELEIAAEDFPTCSETI